MIDYILYTTFKTEEKSLYGIVTLKIEPIIRLVNASNREEAENLFKNYIKDAYNKPINSVLICLKEDLRINFVN